MRLTELLPELQKVGIGVVGTWEMRGRKGVTLGDPQKYFPFPTGPQYPVDCTKTKDPDIPESVVDVIRRHFGMSKK
jgi:hypothetical protein